MPADLESEFAYLVSRAKECEDNGSHAEAIALLDKAIDISPHVSSIRIWLGWIHFSIGNLKDSVDQALTITDHQDPVYTASLRLMIFAAAASGDWPRAKRTFADLAAISESEAKSVAEESHGSFLSFMQRCYQARRYEEVIAAYSSLPCAIKEWAAQSACRMVLVAAAAYLKLGKYHDAVAVLQSRYLSGAEEPPSRPLLAVTLITSIMPGRINIQQQAIQSWRSHGATVVSINAADEAAGLRDHYPDVEFVHADRDARNTLEKPYVFVEDMLKTLSNQSSPIVGIINSDIVIAPRHKDVLARVVETAGEGLVYGHRYDIEALAHLGSNEAATPFVHGYDWFLLPRSMAGKLPAGPFLFGCPWWDLWLPFSALLSGITTVLFEEDFGYHEIHATNWCMDTLLTFGDAVVFEIGAVDVSQVHSPEARQLVAMVAACRPSIMDTAGSDAFMTWLADIFRMILRQSSCSRAKTPESLLTS